MPRWAGARGVTGDLSREDELGDGKWSEPARSLDEVRRQMDDAPVRELELDAGGPPWGLIAAVALVVLGGIGWFALRPEPTPEPPAAVPGLPGAAEAAPVSPQITVDTIPPRGRVLLDGRTYGRAPAVVPVPTDAAEHELCAEFDGARTCRHLTGQAMALEDPHVIDTTR